jgi:hypothetical protein
MKKNDVYQFRFSIDYLNSIKDSYPYHCFDGILIVGETEEGKFFLEDTYWSHGNHRFTPEEAETKGTLTFVCNLDDVVPIHESVIRYYADEDIFTLEMHHGHRTQKYLRKGAAKSSAKMLRVLNERIVASEQKIRYEETTIADAKMKIAEIEAGNVEVCFF